MIVEDCGDNYSTSSYALFIFDSSDEENMLMIYGNNALTQSSWTTTVGIENIKTISIEEGITGISAEIFEDQTQLTTIDISSSVRTIGENTLRGCTSLTTINVAENNHYYSSSLNVLYNIDKTILIQYPLGSEHTAYEIVSGVNTIKQYAFEKAVNLKEITIGNDVTTIETMAFESIPNLQKVTIGTKVNRIDDYAFRYCNNLLQFIVDEGNTNFKDEDGVLYRGTELVHFPAQKNVKKYYMPFDTTAISSYAFYGNTKIEFVITSEGITSVGSHAFDGCTYLKEIYLLTANELTDDNQFANCEKLKEVKVLTDNKMTTDAYSGKTLTKSLTTGKRKCKIYL